MLRIPDRATSEAPTMGTVLVVVAELHAARTPESAIAKCEGFILLLPRTQYWQIIRGTIPLRYGRGTFVPPVGSRSCLCGHRVRRPLGRLDARSTSSRRYEEQRKPLVSVRCELRRPRDDNRLSD